MCKVALNPDGVMMCRLAMVANDLMSLQFLFDTMDVTGLDRDTVGGHKIFLIRQQIATVTTGMDIMNHGDYLDRIKVRVKKQPRFVRALFEKISPCFVRVAGCNRQFSQDYLNNIQAVRHKVAYHNDPGIAANSLNALVAGQTRKVKTITLADKPINNRFGFADALFDRAVTEQIWKVAFDGSPQVQSNADAAVLRPWNFCNDFRLFVCELTLSFFETECRATD